MTAKSKDHRSRLQFKNVFGCFAAERRKDMFRRKILPIITTLVFGAIWFYITLPAINLRSGEFWSFLISLIVAYVVSRIIFGGKPAVTDLQSIKNKIVYSRNTKKVLVAVASVVVVGVLAIVISSTTVFNAKKFVSLLDVQGGEFEEEISEINFSQIPVVDKNAAEILGSRRVGQVVELVSQFEVASYYTQINIDEVPYRVSPLEYAGFLKWIFNRDEGIPYYVKIDMSDLTAAELVELDEGIKYSPSEYFNRDLLRHVRFAYPTKMFEEMSFEVDDNGHPYWILSYYTYRIGIFGGKDIAGIILVDAVTGEMQDYSVEDIPNWIDRVYSADIVLAQAGYYGSLQNGWLNSLFVQKNVIKTTEGYNYLAIDDDVWLYTGITSVMSDNSNIGFILVNMRTKEARRYTINGADEYSAMASAEGKVQEKGYNATFPILLNVKGEPSYFISLKDNAGTIKAYSFVSVTDYQIVGVDYDSIESALATYMRLLEENGKLDGNASQPSDTDVKSASGTVSDVASAVINGETNYYLKVNGVIYIVPVSLNSELPFVAQGDTVTVRYTVDAENKITKILGIDIQKVTEIPPDNQSEG